MKEEKHLFITNTYSRGKLFLSLFNFKFVELVRLKFRNQLSYYFNYKVKCHES